MKIKREELRTNKERKLEVQKTKKQQAKEARIKTLQVSLHDPTKALFTLLKYFPIHWSGSSQMK